MSEGWCHSSCLSSSFQLQWQSQLVASLVQILGINKRRQSGFDAWPQGLCVPEGHMAVAVHLCLLKEEGSANVSAKKGQRTAATVVETKDWDALHI